MRRLRQLALVLDQNLGVQCGGGALVVRMYATLSFGGIMYWERPALMRPALIGLEARWMVGSRCCEMPNAAQNGTVLVCNAS